MNSSLQSRLWAFPTVCLLLALLLITACMPIQPEAGEDAGGTVPAATPAATEEETTEPAPIGTSLEGTTWQLVAFGPPTATLPVIPESIVTVEFTANGEIGGSGGCNTYGGQYEVEGDTLQVSELVSTLRACVDEGITEQEMGFLEALQLADRYELADETLTIAYGEGSGVLTFIPATAVQ